MIKTLKLQDFMVILAVLFFAPAFPKNSYAGDIALNSDMSHIGTAIANLLPLAVDDRAFSDPQNSRLIIDNLATVQNALTNVEPHFRNKTITYQISLAVIIRHIKELIEVYKQGHFYQARSMLKSIGSICTSCHTQDKLRRTLFGGVTRDSFPSDYEFAEYSFITRNYSDALQYYSRYFESLKTHSLEKYQLNALKNVMTIYLQVDNSPDNAIEKFSTLAENVNISQYSRKTIENWISGLKSIRQTLETPAQDSFTHLKVDVEKYLLPDQGFSKMEYHIWLKGRLYRYLSAGVDDEQIPQILLWLSIANRLTDTNFYYSLADLYLKQCMTLYTSSPVAKKCFKEFKENTILSFSGSRGTDIPEPIQTELDHYHDLVFTE